MKTCFSFSFLTLLFNEQYIILHRVSTPIKKLPNRTKRIKYTLKGFGLVVICFWNESYFELIEIHLSLSNARIKSVNHRLKSHFNAFVYVFRHIHIHTVHTRKNKTTEENDKHILMWHRYSPGNKTNRMTKKICK